MPTIQNRTARKYQQFTASTKKSMNKPVLGCPLHRRNHSRFEISNKHFNKRFESCLIAANLENKRKNGDIFSNN